MGRPGYPWQRLEKSHSFRAACILFRHYIIDLHVVFLLSLIVPGFVYNYLALNPDYVMQRPWTLLTHMFVHANFNHLFLNMLFLFFFGMELERRVGETKFLQIYILSGIVAALAQMMISGGSPGGSERRSLWSHGVSGHNCSRDSSAALLRDTYEHSGLGRAICPDGFSTLGSRGQHRTYGPYRGAFGRIGFRADDEETAKILLQPLRAAFEKKLLHHLRPDPISRPDLKCDRLQVSSFLAGKRSSGA